MEQLMKKLFIILLLGFFMPACGFTQTRAEVEDMLDQFCTNYFDDCFPGRTYKNISVDDFTVDNENQQIQINGTVTCLNLFDIRVTQDFESTITVRSSGKIIIYFKKRTDAADGSSFWEDCEKNSEDD